MRALIALVVAGVLSWLAYTAITSPGDFRPMLPTQEAMQRQKERLAAQAGQKQPEAEVAAAQRSDLAPPKNLQEAALGQQVAEQPISIPALRQRDYPGSPLTVVEELEAGRNFSRQIISYQSDGLTIYGLLTVPRGPVPEGGWPAVVFNHGYIPPHQYRTTERYVRYQSALAGAGFVTLKSDYRGHGKSGGKPQNGYGDAGYTVDVLNAAASLRQDPRINGGRIGLWGHSMGGQLSLRAMLVDRQLKAASLWAGVVASYDILATDWHRPLGGKPPLNNLSQRYLWLLSPNAYLADLGGRPLQLHHGTADTEVPYNFQVALAADLRAAEQKAEAYRYLGDNHNLSKNLELALQRTVAFFRANL